MQRIPAQTAMQQGHQCLASPNQHPFRLSQKKKYIYIEKQAAALNLTAHDSLSSSMPTPGNEKSETFGFVRLFMVVDVRIVASPLSFPRNCRKLRIF